jgi:catechol 2,3-dioxygenase-like lactoylglutathione lyase family enzyme
MSLPVLETTGIKFHISLNVASLVRAVDFYRILFGQAPAKLHDDYAKFELADPPVVFSLVPRQPAPGGALNHVGLRMPDSATVVAMQRRLEAAGISTWSEEGVECCYARQTKFWVTDPDRNLWEVYVLEEDIDYHGFTTPSDPSAVIWEHWLTRPFPEKIPHADASVDEVRMEGTFNAEVEQSRLMHLLAEARRVLRPGGRLMVHGLVGDRPFPGKPALPGLAALVQHVPVDTEVADIVREAGFTDLQNEKLAKVQCFEVSGVELREQRLTAKRP